MSVQYQVSNFGRNIPVSYPLINRFIIAGSEVINGLV